MRCKMDELRALLEFQRMVDRYRKYTSEYHTYYHNVWLLDKIVDFELSKPKPTYTSVRDFLIKDGVVRHERLPSLEELCEPDAIQKYWGLPEYEKDPEYIRFESLSEDEKANSTWDFPERFSTTYKTFNPNEYKDPNERNAALEKWLKFRSKEDYEAAKLANWGHEPDEWIGL